VRSQVDRRAVLGEALEQDAPVPDDAVERRCGKRPVVRQLDVDA
jgi:hypothetical protein